MSWLKLTKPFVIRVLLVCISHMMSISFCWGVVTITPANNGTCLNLAPGGAFTTLTDMVITENSNSDFSNQTGTTIIMGAPTGFEFQVGVGSVSYNTGGNFTSATITVDNDTIIVTISVAGGNKSDVLTISGINVRALSSGSSGNIYRIGGTALISGGGSGSGNSYGYLTATNTGLTILSFQNGNWSNPTTWVGGIVPRCGANVQINHVVTADITASTPNLTVNSGGNLVANNSVSVTSTFTINGTGIYTHSNASDASTGIFGGVESLSSTSRMIFNNWYNNNIPLGSLISGTTGDITFNSTGTWQQHGTFSPNKISGNLTVSQGTIYMDNGTGGTTSLTLKDVTISNSGALFIASGTNRNLTLVTGNFTDNSTGGGASAIVFNCVGTINWTANGNVTLGDHWYNIYNAGYPTANMTTTINGNLTMTGSTVNFAYGTNTPLNLVVNGTTTISGSPGNIYIMNGGTGSLNFTTDNMIVSAGSNNFLMGGACTGSASFNIINDLNISGGTTTLYGVFNPVFTSTVDFNVGRDIIITNADMIVANTNSDVEIETGRNLNISGAGSYFTAQQRPVNTSSINVTVNGSLNVTDGIYFHTLGEGIMNLTVTEDLVINTGYFFGVDKTTGAPNIGTATVSIENFILNGGYVQFMDTKTSSAPSLIFNCTNNFELNWQSNTDRVYLLAYHGNNDALLDLNIGGNFIATGNYPGATFISSKSDGDETIDIAGDFNISGGLLYFVNDAGGPGANSHNIVTNINGNILISGGTTFLSTRNGTADVNVGGNVSISAGILNLKHESGQALMDVSGGYVQTGGTFNIHSSTTSITDTCIVTINGDFSQTSGVLNFDNANGGSPLAEHKLYLNGSNYTIGGSAYITHANHLSLNTIFGQLYFNRSGTTVFSRTSSTHEIRQVKQTVMSQTYVDASSSSNNLQTASHISNNTVVHNMLMIYGTLDMGSVVIYARQQPSYFARLTVYNNGRLRTSHTGGLYSGSATASTINGMISGINAMNYDLESNSIVEAYGTATKIITGIPNGIANGTNQEYGILELNHTGTSGTTWAYPETSSEVYIRRELRLTAGEFNLDTDHTTNTGGRIITLRNGAIATRTAGFIRSETEDGSGTVNWEITSNGSYIIPFGYDAANYIPFTFSQTSGATGVLSLATYRTAVDNTPYPPTVTHTRDVFGNENSAYTVDRFWKIETTGTPTSNLTFTYVAVEGTGIVSPRAQLWEPLTMGWFPPAGTQSNPSAVSTLANGIASHNSWWTLSAAAHPLPVTLVEFDAYLSDKSIILDWTTLSEINNDRFDVERSSNATDFIQIGSVAGHGTTSSPMRYLFRDNQPLFGKNYYRLKQVDFNGQFVYSKTVVVNYRYISQPAFFPNPVLRGNTIHFESAGGNPEVILIMDTTGKLIKRITPAEFTSGELNIQDLSKGMYHISVVMADGELITERLIVL